LLSSASDSDSQQSRHGASFVSTLRFPHPHPLPSLSPPLTLTPFPTPTPTLQPRSDPQLQFVEEVALPPPEVQIDLAEQERNERELAEAVNACRPTTTTS